MTTIADIARAPGLDETGKTYKYQIMIGTGFYGGAHNETVALKLFNSRVEQVNSGHTVLLFCDGREIQRATGTGGGGKKK